MAPSKNIYYYGRHFGCLNATHGTECRQCAERLTHAVERVLFPAREATEAHNTPRAEPQSDAADEPPKWREVQLIATD